MDYQYYIRFYQNEIRKAVDLRDQLRLELDNASIDQDKIRLTITMCNVNIRSYVEALDGYKRLLRDSEGPDPPTTSQVSARLKLILNKQVEAGKHILEMCRTGREIVRQELEQLEQLQEHFYQEENYQMQQQQQQLLRR